MAKKQVKPSAGETPTTLGAWLDHAVGRYERARVALGQIATNAHDEALYLLLRTLELPLDSDASVLARVLTASERKAVQTVLRRRIDERVPAAYLTREAWLGEHRFYVDERVIIPRSYFLEIIPGQLDDLLGRAPASVRHVVDVCTGGGSLAILLAHHFPKAKVDAVDLSPDALAVAAINVRDHRLTRRVTLHQSDVFDGVPVPTGGYELILSNPPYEPSAHVERQSPEFKAEPRLAHDGGKDGLVIIRKLLRQARDRLAPDGLVLIEVGALQKAMNKEFAALAPQWLETEDGSNCVCAIGARRLQAWTPA